MHSEKKKNITHFCYVTELLVCAETTVYRALRGRHFLTSYLSLHSDGQSVTVRALGGRHFLHVPMWLQHKFLGHGLVVGVPESQTPIAAFPTSLH